MSHGGLIKQCTTLTGTQLLLVAIITILLSLLTFFSIEIAQRFIRITRLFEFKTSVYAFLDFKHRQRNLLLLGLTFPLLHVCVTSNLFSPLG